MANKSTKAETKKRTHTVSILLLNGASRADIIQYTLENWNITESQTDRYIEKANKGFAESSVFSSDEQIGKALNRLNRLYMSHLENKDYKDALSVQKEINKLLGLYAPERKEVSGPGGGAIKWEQVMRVDPDDTDDPFA